MVAARVIWAAIPRRIWVCGIRTSSWPGAQTMESDGEAEDAAGARPGEWLATPGTDAWPGVG